MTRMLIVDHTPGRGMDLADLFERKGYRVVRAMDGDRGLRLMTSLPGYDIVLLNIDVPKGGGFTVLRAARQAGVDSPVIMLADRWNKDHVLRAFEAGSDDYVTRPFHAEELAARVKTVLRRMKRPIDGAMDKYRFGSLEINFSNHTVRCNGNAVRFTPKEFDILKYLIEHRGFTVSRKQLLRNVWGLPCNLPTRTIDRHIATLRRKLNPHFGALEYIETVYGVGYKFMEAPPSSREGNGASESAFSRLAS